MQSNSKYAVKESDRREGARKIQLQGKKHCPKCRYRIRGTTENHEAGAHHQGNRTGKLANKRGW